MAPRSGPNLSPAQAGEGVLSLSCGNGGEGWGEGAIFRETVMRLRNAQ